MTLSESPAASATRLSTHRISRIAHRGGNGRAALALAAAERVDWIEIDLWYSLGSLVARHEHGFGRCPLVLDGRRLHVLKGGVLQFDEIIRLTDGGPGLFIDLKGMHSRLPGEIVRTLQQYGATGRAAVCGQYWKSLDAIRCLDPGIRVFHSLGRPNHVQAYATRLASADRLDGVSIAKGLVTPELLERYAARDVQVYAWTVNEPALAGQLVKWGVNGIISDKLPLLAGLP